MNNNSGDYDHQRQCEQLVVIADWVIDNVFDLHLIYMKNSVVRYYMINML